MYNAIGVPDSTSGRKVMGFAERGKDIGALEAELQREPSSVNWQNEYGFTPLLAALKEFKGSAVRVLLLRGADPNLKDKNGTTPLNVLLNFAGAFDSQMCLLLKDLIAAGADVNAVINNSPHSLARPLHLAVLRHHTAAIPILLAAGADINLRDAEGYTPVDMAKAMMQTEASAIFRRYDAAQQERLHEQHLLPQIPSAALARVAHSQAIAVSQATPSEPVTGERRMTSLQLDD